MLTILSFFSFPGTDWPKAQALATFSHDVKLEIYLFKTKEVPTATMTVKSVVDKLNRFRFLNI